MGAERLKDLVEKVMWRGGKDAGIDENGKAEPHVDGTDVEAELPAKPAGDNESPSPDDLSKQFIQEGPGGTKFFVQDLEPGCEVPLVRLRSILISPFT
jgi:hypothetical protein